LCGILAYYSKSYLNSKEISDSIQSLNSIKHRGPDGEGVVLINTNTGNHKILKTKDTPNDIEIKDTLKSEYNLLIGHRRLKIIDLSSSGHQPMEFENYWISYNGEIYNYLEIKKELQIKGYKFKSSSDTEIVLKAYHFWGEKCLQKFNGMWSFVIWDNSIKSLFISNDRFGVKPLYIYKSSEKAIFTSEIKQFHFINSILKTKNIENCNLYLNHGYQPLDQSTYFNEISRFPCGSSLVLNFTNNLKNNSKSYYSIYNVKKNNKWVFEDAVNTLKNTLSHAINIRQRSDVELGISISGGIDSSILVQYGFDAHQLKFNKRLKSFSAVSPNMNGDESEFIYEVLIRFSLY
jgi:asparagine synthase (glutamine-hydrolysing)